VQPSRKLVAILSPEAYDYFLRGREARLRFTKGDVALAKQLATRALEIDPQFAMAMALLGRAHRTEAYSGWTSRGRSGVCEKSNATEP
jgi:hypothetical protein